MPNNNTAVEFTEPRRLSLFDTEYQLLRLTEELMEQHEEGTEPTDQQLKLIEEYLTTAEEKRDRVARFIQTVEQRERDIDAEIKRLQKRKLSIAAARERLERFILTVMKVHSTRKLEGKFCTLSAVKCPVSVEITDESAIPPEFLVYPELAPRPDKQSIKETIQAGGEVAGARLITDKESLRVK